MKTATIKMKNLETGAETQSTIQLRTKKRPVIQAALIARAKGSKLTYFSDVSGKDYDKQQGLGKGGHK